MTYDPFHTFLYKTAGATGKALDYVFSANKPPVSSAFFKPYKSASNFFIRTASVVSAPISLTFIAIEMLVAAIFCAIKALVEVCMQEPDAAKECIKMTGFLLLFIIPTLISAIISPIVNLIDLIGGGVESISECSTEGELEMPCGGF